MEAGDVIGLLLDLDQGSLTMYKNGERMGIMVAEGANYIVSGEWWLAIFPGVALMLAVFCFNLLGDGLRDLVDPLRRT